MSSIEKQVIVITGAAGGLGKAIAESFLAAGSKVAICDVNRERISAVTTEWTTAYASRFLATEADITSEESVNSFFASVKEKFGRVDMLVNNAGLMDRFDPVGATDLELFNRVLAVNVTGTMLCCKAAVNIMQAQEPVGGTIINIASVSAIRGTNAGAAYTTSKHAVLGLTKNTAGFYGEKGVYCLALIMGGMATNITDAFEGGVINKEGRALSQRIAPGFVYGQTDVKVEEVAKYCKFFADRSMAEASNGSTVTISKNWPMA